MILVIDNYDSFTFNLVQALQAAGAEVRVIRNDAIDREGVETMADDPDAHLRGIVISPGPGEITIPRRSAFASAANASTPARSIASFRITRTSAPAACSAWTRLNVNES